MAQFRYTPEDNLFRDPNLHKTFTWKKREEVVVGRKEEGGATTVRPQGKEDPSPRLAAVISRSTPSGISRRSGNGARIANSTWRRWIACAQRSPR